MIVICQGCGEEFEIEEEECEYPYYCPDCY